ncbi:MAG: hypothetical protein M1828_006263 [Chrysothrix sp. TS-e1954]|nr:MAG: hypothetical protein M1828_006263 [Chrysothrix sp. TS-e1954]
MPRAVVNDLTLSRLPPLQKDIASLATLTQIVMLNMNTTHILTLLEIKSLLGMSLLQVDSTLSIEHTGSPRLSHRDQNQATLPNNDQDAELPSTEIGLLLLEVYFKRVYDANLLFHKTMAFKLYTQQGIPDYLLRAIFAHAANFLKETDSSYGRHIPILRVQSVFEKSWAWARASSREVLSHVDEPNILMIQSLQVLQLYYFSRGDSQRSTIHLSLAIQLSTLLMYDALHEGVDATSNPGIQFDRELKRRCFWAAWCSSCIGKKDPYLSGVYERIAGLPLPARYGKGFSIMRSEIELGQTMDINWQVTPATSAASTIVTSTSCSLIAELVKLFGIWGKVQALVPVPTKEANHERAAEMDRIAKLLDPIAHSLQLPLSMISSRADDYDESSELLVSVCSLYYLCRLILHALMVPVLSGGQTESHSSNQNIQSNVAEALTQASEFAELLRRFFAENLDVTRLAPFTGYAAFMMASISVTYTNAMGVPGLRSAEMKSFQTVLEVLSIYWRPLHSLVHSLPDLKASPK